MVAWPHADLAQRGQHRADVVEEGAVRADDEHAGPVELGAEGVEQPRGPVQADGGLAGAGAPCTQMLVPMSLRTISSCSGWMVETMSRIGPERGRSISAARMALWSVASPRVRRSSS